MNNDLLYSGEKFIISEYYSFNAPTREVILEAEKNSTPLVMSGILQKADTLNKNGRVYPYEILKREADKYMESVKEGTAGGELDHPSSAVISLSNASHRVIDMWWEGKELWGKVIIAEETTAGKNLKGLLKAGFKLGISSRGVGSVKSRNGQDVVQEDFELIGFDFVSNPSTPGAYLFRESKQMIPIKLSLENTEKTISENNLITLLNKNFWKNL